MRMKLVDAGYVRSYRTYEEWKHINCLSPSLKQNSSYRTYEEWKLDVKGT